jgi:predicted PurR-regulated permease PerM
MSLHPSLQTNRAVAAASNAVTAAIVVAALYFAREVLVPIVLAGLLSFILTPPMLRLQSLGLGRVAAVTAVTLISFAVLAGLGVVMTGQFAQFVDDLPRYEVNLEGKIKSLQEKATSGPIVQSVEKVLERLREPLQRGPSATEADPAPALATPAQPPPTVIMRQPATTPFVIASELLSPLVAPIATAGIVIVFVVFILLQREDLRDRLIWLAGARDLRRTTIALDEAGSRLSRYFLALTAINATFGLLVGVGLWLIGIPNFVLWGLLAMMLRFLPYIGGPLSAVFPMILATAIDPGWWKLVSTGALYVVLELGAGQLVEPLLFGRSAGMSPLAVIIAATFWTWLWGPIGLILSIPLTLLLVVLGRHVERFSFLAVLFGDAPPLTPAEGFYHKVVSGHVHEATEQAYTLLHEQSLIAYYDEVALPGLRLFQGDLNQELLPPENIARIVATIDKIIELANDYEDSNDEGAEAHDASAPDSPLDPEPVKSDALVLCVAGRSPFDRSAADMLSQLLARQSVETRIVPTEQLSPSRLPDLARDAVAIACLSYIATEQIPGHLRLTIRRLRRLFPGVKILVGLWTYEDEEEGAMARLPGELGADLVATSLGEAIDICLRVAVAPPSAAPKEIVTQDARNAS